MKIIKGKMTLLVDIKAEHLAGARYMSTSDCPMARALKGLGYKNVRVGGYTAYTVRNRKNVVFEFDCIADKVRSGFPFSVRLTKIS